MRIVALDTNAVRGLSPERATELLTLERALAVRAYADVWTISELIAHLGRDDPDYAPARAALRRLATRCLLPREESPRVFAPAESQVWRAVFDEPSELHEANVNALIELARTIALTDPGDDLTMLAPQIATVADHVEAKERWFVEHFRELRARVAAACGSSPKERNRVIRAHVRSDEARELDARAMIHRAYVQAGRNVPKELPVAVLQKVMAASEISSHAVGLLFETLLCDDVVLDKSKIVNLLWDQEVAGCLGNTIEGIPVTLVTDDRFFARAADRAGRRASVLRLDDYMTSLRSGASRL